MPEPDQQRARDDLALLAEAAAEAADIAMSYFRRDPQVWMKPGDSPVSEADLAVDRHLRTVLLGARPDYGWVSEEAAASPAASADHPVFVVDPIDGTRAFIDGGPTWCISIAVVVGGRPLAGLLQCPVKGETYAATRGGGATCNASPIRVATPGQSLHLAGPGAMIDALPLELRAPARRHPYIPSLAYRIAMVASGALDATYVKPHSRDWDLAAADLILEEAGGAILDAAGQRLRYRVPERPHGPLVAGSGELLAVLRRHMKG